jgi:hypothetical protein
MVAVVRKNIAALLAESLPVGSHTLPQLFEVFFHIGAKGVHITTTGGFNLGLVFLNELGDGGLAVLAELRPVVVHATVKFVVRSSSAEGLTIICTCFEVLDIREGASE